MSLYTEAEAKLLKDMHESQKDWKARMEPVLLKQAEELKEFGATLGRTADKLSNLEDEYKRNQEDMLRKMREQFGTLKEALDAMQGDRDGMPGLNAGTLMKANASAGSRMAQSEKYRPIMEKAVQGRNMAEISFDDSAAVKNLLLANAGIDRKWTNGITGSSLTDLRDTVTTLYMQELFAEPLREDRVRNYIPVIPVSGSSVQYWQQTDFAYNDFRPNAWTGNQADFVNEAGQKPYSTMTGEVVTEQIRTLAHLFVMSEELMADAPAFVRHVDVYMRGGLDEKEDAQILRGSGAGTDMEGLLLRTGIQEYSWDTDAQPGDTIIDMIARAAAKVRRASYSADACMVGVGANVALKTAKGTDDHYLWGIQQAQSTGRLSIWGVPILETTALADNEGLIGSFRRSVGLLDRMTTTLKVSQSHADLFEYNMVALRYEKRLGLMLVRRKGLCSLDFSDVPIES